MQTRIYHYRNINIIIKSTQSINIKNHIDALYGVFCIWSILSVRDSICSNTLICAINTANIGLISISTRQIINLSNISTHVHALN